MGVREGKEWRRMSALVMKGLEGRAVVCGWLVLVVRFDAGFVESVKMGSVGAEAR